MNILWLASWYPNEISPLDGDFIQRHARAVSIYTPVTVIYVSQYGERVEVEESNIQINNDKNLKEIIVQFRYKRTGIPLVDKIRYNLRYYAVYKKLVKQHFNENGIPDLVHVHVPMKAGVIAKWIKRKWKVPNIVSEHSATYVKGARDAFDNRNFYFRNAVKNIFRDALLVSSVSVHDGNILKKKFHLKLVEVIRNVVDTNYFFFRPDYDKTRFRFTHISVMHYQKNTDGILRACMALKKIRTDWELELIGPANARIKQLIDELDLNNEVLITGQISNPEVAAHLKKASALVMFSRYENFPCTIIEALCCGLPVIATKVGGIDEAINASNGYLVQSEDEQALLTAMLGMLKNYESFNRAKIADEAKKIYSYERIGGQFWNIYQQALSVKEHE
ncbi:MAG: glycosyltransferase [Chitinophagaceae bacterium]|nr:glycosyltransferase [Chitinophagaceae bacterium]